MNIGTAHQRIIRDKKKLSDSGGLFGYPNAEMTNCVLKEVDYQTAKKIIEEYEWLGTMGTTQYHYGIYFDGVCAGVVCFGYFQAMNTEVNGSPYGSYVGEKFANNGIQLTRGACTHWAHEHAGSKLIAYGLRQMAKLGYKYVVAFSDPEAGEIGTLYQATNWHYLGRTKHIHYDIYYTNGKLYMNDRDLFKQFGFSGKERIMEFIKDKPHLKAVPRYAKGRYIKLIGNKVENKIMMKHLADKIQPYPKRDNFTKLPESGGK